MERKINHKIEEAFTSYKQTIKRSVIGTLSTINCKIDEEYDINDTNKINIK